MTGESSTPRRPSVAEERAAAQERQRVERAARREHMADRFDSQPIPGAGLIWASWIGTAIFAISALYSATIGYDAHRSPPGEASGTLVALVLFGIGCVLFVVALALGALRSRDAQMGIGGWFFLVGSAPPAAQRHLLGSLAVEVTVAVVTAAARPFSTLAFGILVPTYGLAICGIWGARHGEFPPAVEPEGRPR
jgi:hypothetical protein